MHENRCYLIKGTLLNELTAEYYRAKGKRCEMRAGLHTLMSANT